MAVGLDNVESRELDFNTFSNIIDGKPRSTPETRHSINPATGEPNAEVPISTQKDLDDAVAAARKAQRGWSRTSIEHRRERFYAFADALERYRSEFVKLVIAEQGKPLPLAHAEFGWTLDSLRITPKLQLLEDVIEDNEERSIKVRYVPIGVTCGIVPWNVPLAMAAMKIAPALYAGNSFILKPSPDTPYCGLKLAELGAQFFPPGILQVLSGGHDLGPLCTAHPDIDKISFTGSIATGKLVMQSCSKTLKRVTLELGGNDAAIVCDDVDFDKAIPHIAHACFINSGQICMAAKRVFVHGSIYDRFLEALVAYTKNLKVGPGTHPDSFIGPVQNEVQYNNVRSYFDDIINEGQRPVLGGINEIGGKGYFVNPTIIDNPPEDSRLVREEPFGPIIPLLKWSDEEEVIARANDSKTGLGASVWSKDLKRAERMVKQLDAGTVWVNSHMELRPDVPFGGHKWSGIGSEWGVLGLKHWCNPQSVWLPKQA